MHVMRSRATCTSPGSLSGVLRSSTNGSEAKPGRGGIVGSRRSRQSTEKAQGCRDQACERSPGQPIAESRVDRAQAADGEHGHHGISRLIHGGVDPPPCIDG